LLRTCEGRWSPQRGGEAGFLIEAGGSVPWVANGAGGESEAILRSDQRSAPDGRRGHKVTLIKCGALLGSRIWR